MIQWKRCEKEGCNNIFIAGYGYSCAVSWLVTGHAKVPGFMCPKAEGGQHWGCSPQHALHAMLFCIYNHMNTGNLGRIHDSIEGPRYSLEDEEWASNRGDDFHIVKDKEDLHRIIDKMIDW